MKLASIQISSVSAKLGVQKEPPQLRSAADGRDDDKTTTGRHTI